MLLLLFELGEGRYALPTDQVKEITPLVKVKKIPRTTTYVAGLMNYRGKPVPVIDLCSLTEDRPCEARFNTRIILLRYPREGKPAELLGLIAENITETFKSDKVTQTATGILLDKALYDQGIQSSSEEMIQWFDIKRLLPEEEIGSLFEK